MKGLTNKIFTNHTENLHGKQRTDELESEVSECDIEKEKKNNNTNALGIKKASNNRWRPQVNDRKKIFFFVFSLYIHFRFAVYALVCVFLNVFFSDDHSFFVFCCYLNTRHVNRILMDISMVILLPIRTVLIIITASRIVLRQRPVSR